MKAIYKIYLLGIAVILTSAFTACVEDELLREASPEDTAKGTQAYFSENNKRSMSFLPTDETTFSIEIGRRKSTEACKLPLQITDEEGVFVVDTVVNFKAGENLKNIEVDFSAMTLGMEADLVISLKPEDATIYGNSSLTISVLRDYKWLDKGTVDFFEQDFGLEGGTVAIQQAEGTNLFRLKDLYNVLDDSDDPVPPGYHLKFYLDPDNNWAALNFPEGFQNLGTGYEVYYVLSGGFATYCSFTSKDNVYSAEYLLTPNRQNLYLGGCSFVWSGDFPGVIADPYEGDATVNLDWTMSTATVSYWGPEGYSYGTEDKYGSVAVVRVDEFEITLSSGKGDIVLSLLTDYVGGKFLPTGEFPINTSNKENTVRAGFKSGVPQGSYVEIPSIDATLFLTRGKVVISEEEGTYTIEIDGSSALDSEVKASWTGTITIVDKTATEEGGGGEGIKAKVKRLGPGKKLSIIRK
ncbi:MAG: hypothetical protein ACOX7E_00810 [Paludibacter sp.]|jgi:hypothetical protein